MRDVDAATFRDTMATLAAPLTVLTYYDVWGRPGGLTISSVCSLSVTPPRVLFCVNQANHGHDTAVGAGRWCLHVLAPGQADLARRFAEPGDRFRGLAVLQSATPELLAVTLRAELTTDALHDGGDHTIVVARVRRVTGLPGDGGLVWHQRGPAVAVPAEEEQRERAA